MSNLRENREAYSPNITSPLNNRNKGKSEVPKE